LGATLEKRPNTRENFVKFFSKYHFGLLWNAIAGDRVWPFKMMIFGAARFAQTRRVSFQNSIDRLTKT
jgi:hypothetical protein